MLLCWCTEAVLPGLQVHVTLTELDLTLMVEKRELTSLKLVQAAVNVAIASNPPLIGSQAVEVHGRVEDLILRDLQVYCQHVAISSHQCMRFPSAW